MSIDWVYAQRAAELIHGSEQKSDKIIFRCVVCGDSKRDPRKKRGAFVRKGEGVGVTCKNCGYGNSIRYFLKEYYAELYEQYRVETFEARSDPNKFDSLPTVSEIERERASTKKFEDLLAGPRNSAPASKFSEIARVRDLPAVHIARKFLATRGIDARARGWDDYRFTDYFGLWASKHDPEKKLIESYDPRIIIPCVDAFGAETGCQARTVVNSKARYLTASFNKDRQLAYGWNRIDAKQRICVTEGAFDADALPNAVAALHGDLAAYAQKAGILRNQAVLWFDNEPGSRHLKMLVKRAAADGWPLAVWQVPAWQVGKDCADIAFLRKENPFRYVKICQGLEAELEVSRWTGAFG